MLECLLACEWENVGGAMVYLFKKMLLYYVPLQTFTSFG